MIPTTDEKKIIYHYQRLLTRQALSVEAAAGASIIKEKKLVHSALSRSRLNYKSTSK